MKITDAIIAADRFLPNRFSFGEKLRWCNELSSMLSQEICKEYDYIECRANAGILPPLPDGIDFDCIENVSVNGIIYTKSDLRSFDNSLVFPDKCKKENGDIVRITYLKKYEPVRCVEFEGEYEVSGNFIGIKRPPFREGDLLKIITEFDETGEPDTEKAVFLYVVEVGEDGIYISDNLSDEGSVNMLIKRIITDETLAPMPYDKMYVEYLMSKYASYGGDYEAYKSFSEQFNTTLDAYRNWYKARNPLCRLSGFSNYWR